MTELKEEQDAFDSNELLFVGTDKKYFDFRVFKNPYKFASIIYRKSSLDDAKDSQNKMLAKLVEFKNYAPAFEDDVFPFEDGFRKEKSNMSDKGLLDWVKIDNNRFDNIKNRVKTLKVHMLYQERMVIVFMLTTRTI